MLQSLLKILNNIVIHHLADNPELIYAMLMEKDMFNRLRRHPKMENLMENLDKVSLVWVMSNIPNMTFLGLPMFTFLLSSYSHFFMPKLLQ